jgi:hypothetical protein
MPPLMKRNRIHLPRALYRLAHADSGNHSIYHPALERRHSHPEDAVPPDQGNAVTAYAQLEPSNFDGDTFRRHLLPRCKNPPFSSFISFSDSPGACIPQLCSHIANVA